MASSPPAYTTTLKTFHTLLSTSLPALSTPAPQSTLTTVPPLSLLSDAASLTKAHTTRLILSLKPPSPLLEGIEKFLLSLISEPIPSLVLSVQLLHADAKERGLKGVLAKEVQREVGKLVEALGELGGEIEAGLKAYEEGGKGEEGRGMQLQKTGRVWEGCDRLVGLAQKGVVGVVGDAVKRQADLVKDAEEELKGWIVECSADSACGSGDEDEEDDGWGGGEEGELEEDEKKTVERVQKRLRSTVIIFFAVGKRRLVKGSEGLEGEDKRIEELGEMAAKISPVVDDLVGLTTEREWEEVGDELGKLDDVLIKFAELAELGRDGKEDKFSEWFRKFRDAVKGSGPESST
ncbi:hypothetical protein BJ508DRAFT_375606 [Ascobolus immersus RN42]|uniref:Cyclin-D1-binding protein 1-like N-terminal domain-containing protein n=1 Tax=Ascobolus immersus RN42 TaxID=1160509 RepID=A0A3N4ILU6_ASCIM|nr:hypothetical protein BJ508DRAFT_375606 [Ascobolus immersus RN42]